MAKDIEKLKLSILRQFRNPNFATRALALDFEDKWFCQERTLSDGANILFSKTGLKAHVTKVYGDGKLMPKYEVWFTEPGEINLDHPELSEFLTLNNVTIDDDFVDSFKTDKIEIDGSLIEFRLCTFAIGYISGEFVLLETPTTVYEVTYNLATGKFIEDYDYVKSVVQKWENEFGDSDYEEKLHIPFAMCAGDGEEILKHLNDHKGEIHDFNKVIKVFSDSTHFNILQSTCAEIIKRLL